MKRLSAFGDLSIARQTRYMHQSIHKNQEMRYHGQPQHTPPCGHQCVEHYQCPSWISANLEILSRVNLNETHSIQLS